MLILVGNLQTNSTVHPVNVNIFWVLVLCLETNCDIMVPRNQTRDGKNIVNMER